MNSSGFNGPPNVAASPLGVCVTLPCMPPLNPLNHLLSQMPFCFKGIPFDEPKISLNNPPPCTPAPTPLRAPPANFPAPLPLNSLTKAPPPFVSAAAPITGAKLATKAPISGINLPIINPATFIKSENGVFSISFAKAGMSIAIKPACLARSSFFCTCLLNVFPELPVCVCCDCFWAVCIIWLVTVC